MRGWITVFAVVSLQVVSASASEKNLEERIALLEAQLSLLTQKVDLLEHDLDQALKVQCSYRWVEGERLGLQGEARRWLLPVVEGCFHSDIRL
jgi:hypothetical protein